MLGRTKEDVQKIQQDISQEEHDEEEAKKEEENQPAELFEDFSDKMQSEESDFFSFLNSSPPREYDDPKDQSLAYPFADFFEYDGSLFLNPKESIIIRH